VNYDGKCDWGEDYSDEYCDEYDGDLLSATYHVNKCLYKKTRLQLPTNIQIKLSD